MVRRCSAAILGHRHLNTNAHIVHLDFLGAMSNMNSISDTALAAVPDPPTKFGGRTGKHIGWSICEPCCSKRTIQEHGVSQNEAAPPICGCVVHKRPF